MIATEAPTGTVTLVFTDVEASTVLWERVPDATRAAIELHDGLLRELLETHGGYEMRTEGDAFKVAFASPAAAVRWCHDVQLRLLQLDWPTELLAQPEAAQVGSNGAVLHRGLRVRMGGHLGVADASVHPTTGRTDYYGTMVNETARVAAAPSGGQVVLSDAAWSVASREDPSLSESVLDLGEHWLKGVPRAAHLWQVLPAALGRRKFPPLRTQSAERTNVVRPPGRFFGRDDDLAALVDAFEGGARLVTLMGPGGTGKTRLSVEYATTRLGDWIADGGVWMCELENANNGLEVAVGVAKALGVRLSGNHLEDANAATQAVVSSLSGLARVLIILDNLEQVAPTDLKVIGEWLEAVPEVRFLATSRHRLQLPGERVVDLRPLTTDHATQLFVERATEIRSSFSVSDAERPRVTEIVEQVDCLPLAVELAASRVDVMSVSAIAKRLGQRFRLLARKGDAPKRQSALRGAIDWSWELLDQAERSALAQCAVFRDGFTVDAADEIIDLDAIEDAPWPIDVIQSLRQKSLLRTKRDDGEDVRLDMYASIHAYATEKLDELGLTQATRERHAMHFLAAGERWAAGNYGPDDVRNMARIRQEAGNLMAAFDTYAADDRHTAARVGLIMRGMVEGGGYPSRYRDMLDAVVLAGEEAGDDSLTARGLEVRGHLRQVTMDARAHGDFHRGLELARSAGDRELEARLLRHLASESVFGRGTQEEADVLVQQAAAIYRELGLDLQLADLLGYQGFIAAFNEDFERAREYIAESMRLTQGKAGPLQLAAVENARGGVAMYDRDYAAAEAAYTSIIELNRQIEEANRLGFSAAYLGAAVAYRGDVERAAELVELCESVFSRSPGRGLRAIPTATRAWLAIIAAKRAVEAGQADEVEPALERAKELLSPLFAPAAPDAEHPEGQPPVAQVSPAVGFIIKIIRQELRELDIDSARVGL